MNLKVIGSGSKGNSYLLESPTGTLILDAGVKFIEIQKALDFNFSGVVGCIVTHRHQDHIKSMDDLMKSGINVYAPSDCADLVKSYMSYRFYPAKVGGQFEIGDFIILPVEAQHDVPCMSFLIVYKPTMERLLYTTDTYYLRNRFNGLDYILIETNYCKDTLDANIEAGYIQLAMKNRLLESHFSLEHVKEFLSANDLSKVKVIVLLHLSNANSDAKRMVREIEELTGKVVVVAEPGRNIPLELYPF